MPENQPSQKGRPWHHTSKTSRLRSSRGTWSSGVWSSLYLSSLTHLICDRAWHAHAWTLQQEESPTVPYIYASQTGRLQTLVKPRLCSVGHCSCWLESTIASERCALNGFSGSRSMLARRMVSSVMMPISPNDVHACAMHPVGCHRLCKCSIAMVLCIMTVVCGSRTVQSAFYGLQWCSVLNGHCTHWPGNNQGIRSRLSVQDPVRQAEARIPFLHGGARPFSLAAGCCRIPCRHARVSCQQSQGTPG